MVTVLLLALQSGGIEWFPDDLLYRHPLADPRAPYAGSRLQVPIREKDHIKIENSLAGQRSMARLNLADGEAVEFAAEAAAISRFDINDSWDMDGVDYRFGFPIVYRRGAVAAKLHPWHVTSHLGDEYAEREERKRIAYARNEIAYGLSIDLDRAWRAYAEAGYAFLLGDPNEPWRWMAGVEYAHPALGPDRPLVYFAMNVTGFEEIDWEVMTTLQAGLWVRPNNSSRGFRFGVEYFRGHSALTQFYDDHDHYWSTGLWLHF
jgi:hypothetical protein